ncbi:hypothetical protein [Marinobacter sp.]|uniref:hypothetical protein n=1 Tax=Marinobacter sp. TaxID=50741 RepID=UPI0034A57FB3
MGNIIRRTLSAGVLILGLGVGFQALADEWLMVEPLSADQLADASGRQGVPLQWQINDSEQNANVSDNVLSGNVVTGDNILSGHAFDNMSGIATVIQNTGNQVVIQDTTQINIQINH